MKEFTNIPTKDEIREFLLSSFRSLRLQGRIKTWTDFANLLDVNRSVLSSAKNGDEKYLTESLMGKIQDVVKDSDRSVTITNSPHSNVVNGDNFEFNANLEDVPHLEDADMIPVIPTYLYKESDVNILEYIQDNDNEVPMTPAVQQFPKTDAIYSVQTMAMYPHLHQGDLIALKVIPRNAPIVNGEMYAVDTKDLGILVRFAYDRGDHIEMRASERADRFESFNIMKTDIFNIFRVVGMIRVNI